MIRRRLFNCNSEVVWLLNLEAFAIHLTQENLSQSSTKNFFLRLNFVDCEQKVHCSDSYQIKYIYHVLDVFFDQTIIKGKHGSKCN